MSFERIGDAMGRKDLDSSSDMMEFFKVAKSIILRRSGVTIDAVSFNQGLLRVTVGHPVEASEIRMRQIQIIRELEKKTGQTIEKLVIRIQ
jgi:hypothetical protein